MNETILLVGLVFCLAGIAVLLAVAVVLLVDDRLCSIENRLGELAASIRDWQSDQPTRLDLPCADEQILPEPNTSNQEEWDWLNDPDGWRHR